MNKFEEIESLKDSIEKTKQLIDFYKNDVKIDNWLTNNTKNSIIRFKDRTEYKRDNIYHRINGPAIDYKNEEKDKYYYKGDLFNTKDEWNKVILKETRKVKIKKLNKQNEQQID